MKHFFYLFFIFCLWGNLPAQDYAPFNATVSKRFYEVANPDSDDYFFYADSVSMTGLQTTYHQYFTVREGGPVGEHPPECSFWGGTTGHILDTTWLGVNVVYDFSQGSLIVANSEGDLLTFNFMLGMGDSALVYENATERYFLKYDSTTYETIYTVPDSVKTYHLLHYDLNGNVSASPLHGFVIKLGKTLGIISFLDAYHFPEQEIGLTLKGQLNPLLGSYHMTYEEMYPWQLGDVFQYREGSFNEIGFCEVWDTYTVMSRVESLDSVYFEFDQSWFSRPLPNITPPACYPINIPLRFVIPKHRDVLGVPFNKANVNSKFTETNYDSCGSYYAIRKEGFFRTYCDSCRCYGGMDGYGSSVENFTYAKGLGTVYLREWGYGPLTISKTAFLAYYSTNGEECGKRVYMGVAEQYAQQFVVSPNPTGGKVQTTLPFSRARVMDMQGKVVFTVEGYRLEMDISHLGQGMYTIEFEVDGHTVHRKIIKTVP